MIETSRRRLLTGAGAIGVAGALKGTGALAQGSGQHAHHSAPMPRARNLSPDQALELLREGNRAFLAGEIDREPSSARQRLELAKGQEPFAAYVTCSDSRVPPELLFGRGLGELFIIRNAGNTVDTVAMGSIEYAVAILKVPLVVVMGHESCGAVDAAAKVVSDNATFPGSIGPMIEPIIPAVLSVRDKPGDPLTNAVQANVSRVVKGLRENADPILLEPQERGEVKVVGAYYSLQRGTVDFFDMP